MRRSPSTWRKAMPRSKASRSPWRVTASSACSTPRWRCTTPGATACRSVFGGNIMEADKRAPGAEWLHSGVDIGQRRARFHQMGRPAGLAAAFRRVGGARLQDRDHAADGAGLPLARCRAAGEPDSAIAESLRIPKLAPVIPPQGDSGAIAEAAKMLVAARKPGDRLRSAGAHASRHGAPGRACRNAAMRRRSTLPAA